MHIISDGGEGMKRDWPSGDVWGVFDQLCQPS